MSRKITVRRLGEFAPQIIPVVRYETRTIAEGVQQGNIPVFGNCELSTVVSRVCKDEFLKQECGFFEESNEDQAICRHPHNQKRK